MSRPAVPTHVVPVWAPNTNYPVSAEPWSATPTKTAYAGESSTGFDPLSPVAAQCMNYALNKANAPHGPVKDLLTSLVNFLCQRPADFQGFVAPGGSINDVAYDPYYRKWYLCGNTENVRSSSSGGWSWDASSLVAAVGSDENCQVIDIDHVGNVVVATSTRYVFELDGSTGSWARRDPGSVALAAVPCAIAYDPIHALWCWMGQPAGGQLLIKTSPDRASWTNRTPSTNFQDEFQLHRMKCKKSSGRIVSVCYRAAPANIMVATSDNGGASWTDRATLATTISSPTEASLHYNVEANEWLYTIGETSGTPSSEVWRSTDDGASWTKIATLTAACIKGVSGISGLWLGVALTGTSGINLEVVYSLDAITWRFSGVTNAKGTVLGDNQFLAFSAGNVWPGPRFGLSAKLVT